VFCVFREEFVFAVHFFLSFFFVFVARICCVSAVFFFLPPSPFSLALLASFLVPLLRFDADDDGEFFVGDEKENKKNRRTSRQRYCL